MKKEDVSFLEALKEQYKLEFKEYLELIKAEKEKGERICDDVAEFLNIMLDSQELDLTGLKKYSSGRLVKPFDKIGVLLKNIISEEEQQIEYICYCDEEIEAYARSLRIFKIEYRTPKILPCRMAKFVQVFDFKPPKI